MFLCWNRICCILILINYIYANKVLIKENAYQDIVIEIRDDVPEDLCHDLINNLENYLSISSKYLFDALDGKAYFGSFNIILPSTWSNQCVKNVTVMYSHGEPSDMIITDTNPIYGNDLWTQQSSGCGDAGDQMFGSYQAFIDRDSVAREFVREWTKYRYGVFDEIGYENDTIYPICYRDGDGKREVTGCSDAVINSQLMCDDANGLMNFSQAVDSSARTSILFGGAEASQITMFCDKGTHNRFAPTKHNHICHRESVLDVILRHSDFKVTNYVAPGVIVNTQPIFNYQRRTVTRYIVIVDDTPDIVLRDTLTFLRDAVKKWINYDLAHNETEVGIWLMNGENKTEKAERELIKSLELESNRDTVASSMPHQADIEYKRRTPRCPLPCAIKKSVDLLQQRANVHGVANSVILVIAPGMDKYNTQELEAMTQSAKDAKVKISTINYPTLNRRQELDQLAVLTGGAAFSVFEKKHNEEQTLLTTYFELSNILMHISALYYQGNAENLPIEIYRKELVDRNEVSSEMEGFAKRDARPIIDSFFADNSMESINFYVYVYNERNPLIKRGMGLTSPSNEHFTTSSDSRSSVRQLSIAGVLSGEGSWSYKIERVIGNPQPHYVQVIGQPKMMSNGVIRAKAWVHRPINGGPNVIFTEVKRGDLPIMNALVEVTVIVGGNKQHKMRLLDSGNGEPDLMKGDGIYSRYFNAIEYGPGLITFEIAVTDNGLTAYNRMNIVDPSGKRCCGSFVPTASKTPLPSFQRNLVPITIFITEDDLKREAEVMGSIGRIGDLHVAAQNVGDNMRVTLEWTGPDIGGGDVERYEIKYASGIEDIVDNYDNVATTWPHGSPLAYATGDVCSFTLNLALEPQLVGKVLYFAIRSYSQVTKDTTPGPISNFVRIVVHKQRPLTTNRPYSYSNEFDQWENEITMPSDDADDVFTNIENKLDVPLELLIPIIIGSIIVCVIIGIYCYCCFTRRRHSQQSDQKKPIKSISKKNLNSQINVIVPTSPVHQQNYHENGSSNSVQNYLIDLPDHHTVGLPIYNSQDDNLNRNIPYIDQQYHDKQLIEELKQHQYQQNYMGDQLVVVDQFTVPSGGDYSQNCNVSIISSNNTTLTRNGRFLSPYESWTPSQLLHEHERRQSPLESDLHNLYGDHHQYQHPDKLPPIPPHPYQGSHLLLPSVQSTNNIYSTSQDQLTQNLNGLPQYSTINRSTGQGSILSGDKKIRNVTMV